MFIFVIFFFLLLFHLGTTMNDKEEDEKGFEWINNSNHPRIYATTAVAEQNALSTFNSNTMFIPKEVIPQPWPNTLYAPVGNKHTHTHRQYNTDKTTVLSVYFAWTIFMRLNLFHSHRCET